MLKVAGAADCYQSLTVADYTKPVEMKDNTYDAIISIGVYSKRFKQIFLNEMLRILKAGGTILFSCRPVYYDEVADTVKAMHAEQLIVQSSVVYDDYMTGQQARAYYVSLQKTT